MPSKKTTSATERLRSSRAWPKNTPMPKAGAYKANSRWTYDEEQLLRKNYAKHGIKYCARLLGRSQDAVKIRASRLGIEGPAPRWSDRESAQLRRWFGKKSDKELASMLGRTTVAVRQHANTLGLIPKRAWSDEHLELLRRHYGSMNLDTLSAMIGRKRHTVTSMAHSLGLTQKRKTLSKSDGKFIMKHVGKRSFKDIASDLSVSAGTVARSARANGYEAYGKRVDDWKPEEDERLRKLWPTMLCKDIARLLGRSVRATQAHAKQIGIAPETGLYARDRSWSAAENKTLRSLYGTMSRKKIAERLGRTEASIKRRIAHSGLHKEVARKETWSRKDDALLRELYSTLGVQAIAFRLGKSSTAVRLRAEKLGIGDSLHDAPWMPRDDARLRKLYPLYNNREIGRRIGRSVGSIQHRAKRLGLSKPPTLKGTLWTPKEDAQLRRLFGTMSIPLIAEKLNRSPRSVHGRLRHLGLKKYTRKGRASDL